MKKEELLSCQFSSWYPRFVKNTIKSCIIPLPSDFVDYLQFDGSLVLPKDVKLGQVTPEKEWEESEWENSSEENIQPEFTELVNKISVAIAELGGNVFPKLGWSAPRDASWINNNTLKCSFAGEIFLLLKSSDFIQHDLSSIFKLCEEPIENHSHELVLRKWANLSPGMEFRCFVCHHHLIGISQREDRQYYDFVEADKETLAEEIQEFVTRKVLDKFPNDSYAVDLYKKRNGRYWIIDFNPFAECTDSLLFTWQELKEGRLHDCSSSVDLVQDGCVIGQFRYTDKTATLQPSDYLSCRMPVDFVDLSTGSDATKLVDFMRMCATRPFLQLFAVSFMSGSGCSSLLTLACETQDKQISSGGLQSYECDILSSNNSTTRLSAELPKPVSTGYGHQLALVNSMTDANRPVSIYKISSNGNRAVDICHTVRELTVGLRVASSAGTESLRQPMQLSRKDAVKSFPRYDDPEALQKIQDGNSSESDDEEWRLPDR